MGKNLLLLIICLLPLNLSAQTTYEPREQIFLYLYNPKILKERWTGKSFDEFKENFGTPNQIRGGEIRKHKKQTKEFLYVRERVDNIYLDGYPTIIQVVYYDYFIVCTDLQTNRIEKISHLLRTEKI